MPIHNDPLAKIYSESIVQYTGEDPFGDICKIFDVIANEIRNGRIEKNPHNSKDLKTFLALYWRAAALAVNREHDKAMQIYMRDRGLYNRDAESDAWGYDMDEPRAPGPEKIKDWMASRVQDILPDDKFGSIYYYYMDTLDPIPEIFNQYFEQWKLTQKATKQANKDSGINTDF